MIARLGLFLIAALLLAGCEHNPLEQLGYDLNGPGKSYQPPAPQHP